MVYLTVLVWSETQTVSSRTGTRIGNFISLDNNHYTKLIIAANDQKHQIPSSPMLKILKQGFFKNLAKPVCHLEDDTIFVLMIWGQFNFKRR